MRRSVKTFLHNFLYVARFYHGVRYITQRYPLILVYHRFGPGEGKGGYLGCDTLKRQLKFLKRTSNIISLRRLYEMTLNGDPLPPRSVVITIDDGYDDFFRYAFPVFKEFQVPATVFVVSEFIDQNIWLWPDLIAYIVHTTHRNDYRMKLNDETYNYQFQDPVSRQLAWSFFADHALSLSDRNCRAFIKDMAQDLKVTVPDQPPLEYRAMSWQQIREISQQGLEIGSHTCTHPRLTRIDMPDLARELEDSKAKIEQQINKDVEGFCYPFGRKADIDNNVKCVVKNAGYLYATIGYFNLAVTADPFELKRLGVDADHKDFIKKIYGWEILKTFLLNRQFDR